jgi:CIC family chloride channel protein
MSLSMASSSAPARTQTQAEPETRVNLLVLCLLSLVIGLATGVGAWALRALIGLIHNIAYYGRFNYLYDANILESTSRFGNWIILAPIIGGLIVVFLVRQFAPEAKGHGVPEVMDAIFYTRGNIRGLVAVIKTLASALSIGTGAAVGREGPIIQIGSSLGSAFSQLLKLNTTQKVTLISAGAGAGIAATFNTPLGGVLFATEILLPEVSNRTFLPVVVATGAATLLGRILIGPNPAFDVPSDVMPLGHGPLGHGMIVEQVIAYSALGLLVGVGAWLFIRVLVFMEDYFPEIPGGPYIQNIIGMAIMGGLMIGLAHYFGHYYVDGVGYGVIQAILAGGDGLSTGGMQLWALLGLLFVLKLVATTVSLGSGASGGIFSPSLFMGATIGGAFALIGARFIPGADLHAPSAAIIGMAAMVGAASGAVMTAIVMVFEMTRDYEIIVPVIVAVAVAAGMRRLLISETIYTVKLRHRGHRIPKERHANLYLESQAQDVMERNFVRAQSGAPLAASLQTDVLDDLAPVVVERDGRIVGLVQPRSGLWSRFRADPNVKIEDFMERTLVLVRDTDLLGRALARLKRHRAGAAIVYTGEGKPAAKDVVGVVTKRAIADIVINNFDD